VSVLPAVHMTTDRNVIPGVGALAWADADQVRLMEEKCILVDEKDQVIGSATKKECTLHLTCSPRRDIAESAAVPKFNSIFKLI